MQGNNAQMSKEARQGEKKARRPGRGMRWRRVGGWVECPVDLRRDNYEEEEKKKRIKIRILKDKNEGARSRE